MTIYFNKFTASIVEIFRHTTIEPSVVLLNVSIIISNLLFTNLYLQKSCRFNATSEPDLSTPCDDEKTGQQYVTQVNTWRYFIGITLMILFTIFALSWSEKSGKRRRPILYIPQLGQTLVTVVGCLSSYFWQWPVASSVILEILLHGTTGGRYTMAYAAQMYICDITSNAERTARLGVLAVLYIFAVIFGNGIAGFLMKRLGLFVCFCIDCGLTILGIVLGLIFIKDTSVPMEKKLPFWKAASPTLLIRESLKTVCRKRSGKKRILIWMLLYMDATTLFLIIGESAVLYMYLRIRFGWNEEDYSLYILFKLTVMFFGTLFSTIILSKYVGIRDSALGLLSSILSLIAVICLTFANQNWQLWAFGGLEVLRSSTVAIISSLLTKCLDENEAGHLMSIRCILGFVTTLCFPVYNYVYRNTMDLFPSAFFFISGVIYLPHIILFGLTYYWSTRSLVAEISPHMDIGTQ